MSEIRYYHVTPTEGVKPVADLAATLLLRGSGGYVWVDLHDPSREQLAALALPFGIHPLTVDDCLDSDQVPKSEDFPTYTFVLVNSYRLADDVLEVDEVDVVFGGDFVLSVHGHAPPHPRFLDSLDQLGGLGHAVERPEMLVHALLDLATDRKLAVIDAIQDRLGVAEDALVEAPEAAELGPLLRLRKDLLILRKGLFREREILIKLTRRDAPFIGERSVYHFRDILDHLTKLYETVDVAREMVANAMELYLSTVNNQMAQAANRTNVTVRRLTLITTVFMPLTLLAGIGGMSEWSMMTGPDNWRISYPIFVAAMVVIGLLSYRILLRIERSDPDGR